MTGNHWKRKGRNPFRVSFFSVAVICCVSLSIVFFYISHINNQKVQERYTQEKMELILQDFEAQLQVMEDVSLRIASNYEFHPFYFKQNVARELSMLETFRQYRYYTALTEECFLYYGGDRIYRSTGSTLDLELYMETRTGDPEEWKRFREALEELRRENDFTMVYGQMKVLPELNGIYVLIPFRVREEGSQSTAVLGFVVEPKKLYERFQIVSGGVEGSVTLYEEDEGGEILFFSQDAENREGGRRLLEAVSEDGRYRLSLRIQREGSMQNSLFFLQMVLVLADVLLVFEIANIFAKKAYMPIQVLAEKYKGRIRLKKEKRENALDELGDMMDSMLQSNQEAVSRIRRNEKLLRNQLLQMLVDGSALEEVLPLLEKAGIQLPGPVYCVISLSFEKEEGMTRELFDELQEELEQISDEKEKEYIYVICGFERKLLNVICSMPSEDKKEVLAEVIRAVAESFGHRPVIGSGNTYQALRNLSASWMESMDEILNRKKEERKNQGAVYQYRAEELQGIVGVLANGNEEEAMKRLASLAAEWEAEPISMLTRQYILADFLGEMRKLYGKYHLEISKKNISLLISARNARDFERAAGNMLHEFCEGYKEFSSREGEKESDRICEFINAHFSEYDISIEKVAESLHTSTDTVRQAVLKRTGKLYRDYLIYLRIEYAKELLAREDISVTELCRRVGYGNVSHFIKLFREVTGVTPAKYRKKSREEKEKT